MRKIYWLNFIIFLIIGNTFAQSAREMGYESYKKAEYESAIQYLAAVTKTNPTDSEAWNILGMSYLNLSKFKESHKAFEKAIKQNPQEVKFQINMAYCSLLSNKLGNAEKEIKQAILLDSKNATAFYIRGLVFLWNGKFDDAIADANQSLSLDKSVGVVYLLKSNAYLYKFGQEVLKNGSFPDNVEFLQKAVEVLENCAVNCHQTSFLTTNQKKLDELKVFYQYFDKKKGEEIGSYNSQKSINATNMATSSINNPTEQPLNILSKPKPSYTDSARQAGVQGTITLAVLFSADGKTKIILPLKPLSNGLTEEAVKAALQIQFSPPTKDGKPISVVKMLQYTFSLY